MTSQNQLFSLTLDDQIDCVKREIDMRKRVYPRWVDQGRMTQQKADYELRAMEAVQHTLIEYNERIWRGKRDKKNSGFRHNRNC